MVTALSELVHFVGEETALVSRVKQAVEWVASKPEGHAILEEARALHGKPLKIITDSTVHNIGYGDHLGNHVVFANPLVSDHMHLHGQNGERIHNGLERFLSHEFQHAAQPNLLEHAQQYVARRAEIVAGCFPEIPMENYMQRINAVKGNNAALKELLGEMYDAHIGPKALQMTENMIRKVGADPIVQEFAAKYEVPAIEFENLMMKKYKGEPWRTTDYVKSGDYEQLVKSTDRDGFIESALASIRVHVPEEIAQGAETFRGGKRTEPAPRNGGWAKNS
jgi:hypothetical protein